MKILDIGANVGNHSKAFCNNNTNFVVAVEPNPALKPSLDGLNIVWETKAVSHTDNQKLNMHVAINHVLNSLNPKWLQEGRFSTCSTGEMFTVETVTIDSLVEKYGGFDHIKMDVEGYEDQAILGMTYKYCPIQFEWAAEWLHVAENVLQHLIFLGYDKFNFGGDFNPETLPDYYLSCDELINELRSQSKGNSLSMGMILVR